LPKLIFCHVYDLAKSVSTHRFLAWQMPVGVLIARIVVKEKVKDDISKE